MSVTSLDKDFETLSLDIVAEFDAPVERVWQLWADPRKLERWWGPPTYPATVKEHDLTPGGTVGYFMTGPEGDTHHGYWRSPRRTRRSRWSSSTASPTPTARPNAELPTTSMTVELSETDGGTRVQMRSTFDSREQMDQMVAMGMVEGIQEAMTQMDALLAA